ncbi:MAG: hypothetical protein L0H73_06600 [Nitrococcus sp.]|nr:hypothetical protein [Nitrococcus sp.]
MSCWQTASLVDQTRTIAGLVFMLPALTVAALVYTRRCGPRVYRQTGLRPWRQFVEQITLGVRLAVPPPWYYGFEFYRPAHRLRAAEYLYAFELKRAVYRDIRQLWSRQQTLDALSDKALFSIYCQQRKLAVVPVAAIAAHGQVTMADGESLLPRTDLFFKPRKGAGGRGAARWYYAGDGIYRATDSTALTAKTLQHELEKRSLNESYIVRPLVSNHVAFGEINAGALSTVRVMTCWTESGAIVVTHAVLRMASIVGSPVDNFHKGGIAAPVDLATGVAGQATDIGWLADSAWHTHHPASGAAIAGFELPFWHETLALARAAHAAFDDQILVGWDIAILEDGPYLVEGNKGPDLDIIQRLHREPAGNSQIGRSLAYYLRCSKQAGSHTTAKSATWGK